MKFKKDAVVSARLHESTKDKLYKTGYNAADAIEWFVHEWYNNNPKRKIAIKKDILEIQLANWKKVECDAQIEIEALEKQIEELIVNEPEDIEPVPTIDEILPDNLQEAVDIIKPVYEDKKDLLVGKNTTPDEALDLFVSHYGDFVLNVYNEHGKGLKFKEFKELLLSEVIT